MPGPKTQAMPTTQSAKPERCRMQPYNHQFFRTKSVLAPSFFQEKTESALIARVACVQHFCKLPDSFLARLLEIKEERFTHWKEGKETLPKEKWEGLEELWQMFLRLASFYNWDMGRLGKQLEARAENRPELKGSPFRSPWAGETLRSYLEASGWFGIREVARWIGSFRNADVY